jgi:hypothetical protein
MMLEELNIALQRAALTYVREVNRRWQNRPENQTNGRPTVSCQDRLTKGSSTKKQVVSDQKQRIVRRGRAEAPA